MRDTHTELEAAAFRRLLRHLNSDRTDVQNIDLMILAGFCRKSLGDWYREAAEARGVAMSKDEARTRIYGEPFAQWKAKHQKEATPQQLAAFEAAQNKHGIGAMIECVIFDCDGTLVDSEYLGHLGLEILLRDCGVSRSAESLLSQYKGWKLANLCEALESEHSIALPASFVPDYRRLVEKLFTEHLKPVAGVELALSAIKLPMSVASSGPPEKISQALALTGLQRFFGGNVFSSYVVKSWKPEPGLFLHAAYAMGFTPKACAVVEDSEVGIQAAIKAGMRAWLFTDAVDELGKECFPGVASFNDMRKLPELIHEAQYAR